LTSKGTRKTFLAEIVNGDTRSQAEIVRAWTSHAALLREDVTLTVRQLARWLAGELIELPHPAACRVSESFWRRPITELLGPPPAAPVPTVAAPIEPQADASSDIRTLLMNAAHESSDHAATAGIYADDASIESLRDRVIAAAHQYATTPPLELHGKLVRIRNTVYQLLDRTSQPAQETDLYQVASLTCSLLGSIGLDLGVPEAAAEQARSGATYGRLIGHPMAQAYAYAVQCTAAIWTGQPSRGAVHASRGLALVNEGPLAARLHAVHARCLGMQGLADEADDELQRALDAYAQPGDGIVVGEFGFDPARLAFSAGSTYIALNDGRKAAVHSSRAVELYEEAPEENRWYGGVNGARADLVTAHVLARDLGKALAALQPILELEEDFRTYPVVQRLLQVQPELAARHFQGSPDARGLAGAIEYFIASSQPHALPAATD
jgi:tetratricopeptide (TPR) repeat protein